MVNGTWNVQFFNELMWSMKWNDYFDVSKFQNEWISTKVEDNFWLKDILIIIYALNLSYDAIGMYHNNISSIHYS